jgi:catechol 2,3-dioxygenase-like lactoylglutathione lyase family enzyme
MEARAAAALPVQDLERAKRWYSEKLGLNPVEGDTPGGYMYELSAGTGFLLFESTGKPSGDHTQMALEVQDVEATVKDLKGRGVKFEDYDTEQLKTKDGIADFNGFKGAWFKDSEGNLIAVGEPIPARVRS